MAQPNDGRQGGKFLERTKALSLPIPSAHQRAAQRLALRIGHLPAQGTARPVEALGVLMPRRRKFPRSEVSGRKFLRSEEYSCLAHMCRSMLYCRR